MNPSARINWEAPATGRPHRYAVAPLITIAVPAYNRPAMLADALESIAAQTAQVPLEVIVCDDGRLEETRRLLGRFNSLRFRYIQNHATLGAVGNWNKCLRMARGEYVTVLHEDDALYPWYLETVIPHLRYGTAAVCVKTSRGAEQPPAHRPAGRTLAVAYPPGHFLKSSMTPFPGVMMRRDVALRVGGFNEAWGPLADYEFWYRLACAGPVEVVQAVGAFYRVAPRQWTERVWADMLRLTHLLRLKIAREQYPGHRHFGRWMARFFTSRNARCYAERFGRGPAILERCLGLTGGPTAHVPAGWAWQALKFASARQERHLRIEPDAGRTPQIQQGRGRPDRVAA
jgi:glycosyltransferase involved in cell wall biosynthesis